MKVLEGKSIYLRAIEPNDLDYLYTLENDDKVWEVSHTITPYSKFVLKQYLDNAHKDIYEAKQLRMVIVASEDEAVLGFADLFDFDPKHRRAGVGIVIFSEKKRGKGYASEVLSVLIRYAKAHLELHQLYANISEGNQPSIHLFEKLGFERTGEKKDWILSAGKYKNELLYQRIISETNE